MASNPAQIMGSAQSLVADPVAQDLQRQMAHLQIAGATIQNQAASQQLRMQQIALQRQQSFGGDMQNYLKAPSAEGLAGLFGKYPEFAAPLKDAYGAMDEQRRRADTTQIGSAASLAAAGDYAGAAKLLETRIAADKAAGHDASTDQSLYDHLTSEDPGQRKAALGMMTIALGAAVGPEHAAEVLKANGMDRAPVAVGMDQRLVVPSTGQTVVGATPKLESVGDTLVTGETVHHPFNPYTGKFGAAAVEGGGAATTSAPTAGGGGPASGGGAAFSMSPAVASVASTLSSSGLPAPVVAGFMGNFHAEGGYTGAQGDGGSASGIAQLRGERRQNFVNMFGVDPSKASPTDQAKFVAWEMRNPAAAGMTVAQRDQILAAKTPAQAAALIDRFYERSNGRDRKVRMAAASAFAGGVAPSAGESAADPSAGAPDPYSSVQPSGGGASVNTKGAPTGFAWNADHTAVVPLKGGAEDLSAYPQPMIRDAAVELLTTGQMPSFGMGGGAIKKAILDERSKIMKQAGITADQLPTFRARYGADKASLQQISQIESGLHASESALKPYMDQVRKTHQALVDMQILDNGTPALNALRLGTYSHVGSGPTKAAITQYRDALNALKVEYGKFMSSASGMSNAPTTDRAANVAESLNDEAIGPAALNGHLSQLQAEARIKMDAVTNQRKALEQKLSGYLGGAAPHAPSNIPADAVTLLRQNPSLKSAFDAKYGAGAAARVLGAH